MDNYVNLALTIVMSVVYHNRADKMRCKDVCLYREYHHCDLSEVQDKVREFQAKYSTFLMNNRLTDNQAHIKWTATSVR